MSPHPQRMMEAPSLMTWGLKPWPQAIARPDAACILAALPLIVGTTNRLIAFGGYGVDVRRDPGDIAT